MPDWRWDGVANRYRDLDTGRFLSREKALSWVDACTRASDSFGDTMASLVSGGRVNAVDWLAGMRQEIKEEYIRQYLLGRGGLEQMTPSDWGSIGGMLKEQYSYLSGFYQEIAAGNLSEAQIAMRSNMYTNSAREAFERAQAKVAAAAGMDEVIWEVSAGVENCEDCLAFAAMGWQPVSEDPYNGAYPGSGDTQCLTNCQCFETYRKSETGEVFWEGE